MVRDGSGKIVPNKNVSFRISILQNSETGTVVYSETHSATTNDFGLANLQIGQGALVSGTFSPSGWGANTHYVKIELDANGGSSYSHLGTSQFVSVPYAFHAETVTNDKVDDADANPTNEIQQLSISGTLLELSNGGGSVTLPTSGGGSADNWGTQKVVSDATLTGEGTTASPLSTPDSDPTNELQTLNLNGSQLSLSNGGGIINLPSSGGGDDWGTQKVVTDASISGDGTTASPLSTPDSDPTNELQTLSKTGNSVTLSNSGGTFTDEVDDADANPTNEIQQLSISGTLLELSNGGGSVTLPTSGGGSADNWGTQKVVSDATLTGEGTTASPLSAVADNDGDSSNEIQTLSISGNDLELSNGGGTVTLPSSGGSSAWTTSGSNVYRSSGNVGIGTIPNSAFALDITKSSDATAMRLKSGSNDVALVLDKHATANFAYIMYNTNEVSKFHTGLNGNDNYEISSSQTNTVKGIEVESDGDVKLSKDLTINGSETISGDLTVESDAFLQSELEVNGSVTVDNDLTVGGDIKLSKGAGADKVLTSDASGNATWQTPATGGSSPWTTSGSDVYRSSGNVGIGVAIPNTDLDIQDDAVSVNFQAKVGSSVLFLDKKNAGDNATINFQQGSSTNFYAGLYGNNKFSIKTVGDKGLEIDGDGDLKLSNDLTVTEDTYLNYVEIQGDLLANGSITIDEELTVAGEINRTSTGTANMVPVAYGTIASNGAVNSGSGNISVTKTTGVYTITITGESYSWSGYIATATISYDAPLGMGFIYCDSSANKLVIRTFDSSGVAKDMYFSFVIYKP